MAVDPQTLHARLLALIEPALAEQGVELVALEVLGGAKRPLLRIYLDQEGGIGIEDCARLSRSIGAMLDLDDPFAMRYILEVSSPGLNRPLAKPEHYKRHIGQRVRLKTRRPIRANAKNYLGTLTAFREAPARIELTDELGAVEIPLDDILRANIDYAFEKDC